VRILDGLNHSRLTWKIRRKLIPTKARPMRDGNQWIAGLLVQPETCQSRLQIPRAEEWHTNDEESAAIGQLMGLYFG